jgi:hypothetical protein
MVHGREPQLVLAVEDVDSEGGILNRRRWEDDNEQSPLLRDVLEDGDLGNGFKSSLSESVPWWKKPSVRCWNPYALPLF